MSHAVSDATPATARRASELGVVACHGCGLVCDQAGLHQPCPRCGETLHRRKPDSLSRASALLIAGMILYLPANLLPVMRTTMFGAASDSTIISGVIDFWRSGAWDIALIIFIASIAVPCTKFLAMGLLLWRAHRPTSERRNERARLYRLVELVGYWSMLDVLVVGMVCALVQFEALSSAEPRAGIFFFGTVVILTMLSAMQYDPRLIWDTKDDNERSQP